MDFIQPKVIPNSPISQAQLKPIVASPFFLFLADQQKAIKDQNSNIKLLDLATNAIKEWDQTVSIQDEYTAKFLEESEKNEAAIISNSQASISNQPQIKIDFDSHGNPIPPKRPSPAFFLYANEVRDQVKRENPHLRLIEISKLVGERWKALDQGTKSYYEAKSQEVKALYEQQVALFEATYGKLEKRSKARGGREGLRGGFLQMNSHPNQNDDDDDDDE